MSRILIVGSFQKDGPVPAHLFQEMCRRLGALLADRGHELVVCSDSGDTADRLAVEGANSLGRPDRPANVRFFASAHELESVSQADFGYPPQTFPHVACVPRFTNAGWFATYNEAIGYADAVISLGGSPRGTGGALFVALARSTPVLAIPAAGGFSATMWDEFDDEYNTLPANDQLALHGTDPQKIAETAVRSVEVLIAHNPFPVPRRGWGYLLLPAAMIALGTAWVVLTTVVSTDYRWLPYATAAVMAIAGMLFRYVNDSALKQEAYAGVARVAKDVARVLGALLGVFVVVYLFSLQANADTEDPASLFAAWLAVAGFAAGFLVEEVTGMLKNALSSAVGAGLKKA